MPAWFVRIFASILGVQIGDIPGTIIAFWLYPRVSDDFLGLLADFLTLGRFGNTLFVWLVCLPGLVCMLFLCKRYLTIDPLAHPWSIIFTASFTLIFIHKIDPIAYIYGGGIFEYCFCVGGSWIVLVIWVKLCQLAGKI